jgi:hypothetical protein
MLIVPMTLLVSLREDLATTTERNQTLLPLELMSLEEVNELNRKGRRSERLSDSSTLEFHGLFKATQPDFFFFQSTKTHTLLVEPALEMMPVALMHQECVQELARISSPALTNTTLLHLELHTQLLQLLEVHPP